MYTRVQNRKYFQKNLHHKIYKNTIIPMFAYETT